MTDLIPSAEPYVFRVHLTPTLRIPTWNAYIEYFESLGSSEMNENERSSHALIVKCRDGRSKVSFRILHVCVNCGFFINKLVVQFDASDWERKADIKSIDRAAYTLWFPAPGRSGQLQSS